MQEYEELADLRQQRTIELASVLLEDEDPLNACLKQSLCNLMNAEVMVSRVITQGMAFSEDPGQCLENAEPAINTTIKLANQIEKLGNLITKRERVLQEVRTKTTKYGFKSR
jgi:hypothetical protein